MNRYRQLTSGERYALSALRKQGCNQAAIARALGRHRSTISREVRRNSKIEWAGPIDRTWPMTTPGGDRGRSRRNEPLRCIGLANGGGVPQATVEP